MFHVYHLHGGGMRWRWNPAAEKKFDFAEDRSRQVSEEPATSTRLDSQTIGPGESYNLEIEGGAGGVQQAAGEFLFPHCHIASHYVSGMWALLARLRHEAAGTRGTCRIASAPGQFL